MRELLSVAVRNLKTQRFRTALTLLGIIIGISVIVAMISVGEGLQGAIAGQIEQMGSNSIMIMPGAMQGPPTLTLPFTQSDLDAVRQVSGIADATGAYMSNVVVEKYDKKVSMTLRGLEPSHAAEVFGKSGGGFEITHGRWMKKGEKALVIGADVTYDVFDKELGVGDYLVINDQKFNIVGVLSPVSLFEMNNGAMTSISAAWELFGTKNQYHLIFAKSKEGLDPAQVAENVNARLKRKRGKEDFHVMTSAQLLRQISDITRVIKLVLGGIASISLVVGGIGIINTMLMSVIERTKEIGVMKAIGASRPQIMQLFMAEAAIIGTVGGLLGLVGGYGLSKAISLASSFYDITVRTIITPQLAVGGFAFALGISLLAGIYPARQAASLDPITTLRYE